MQVITDHKISSQHQVRCTQVWIPTREIKALIISELQEVILTLKRKNTCYPIEAISSLEPFSAVYIVLDCSTQIYCELISGGAGGAGLH